MTIPREVRQLQKGPSGAEMAAHRKARGWTQRQLAQAAGVGRTTVQYWEAAPLLDPRGWAVRRMAEALGCADWLASYTITHARGDGVLSPFAAMDAWAEAQVAAFKAREAERLTRRRVVCGARNRKGLPCRNKSEPGKQRCKFHGGKSTGARTPEGIEKIREAQRLRWERHKGVKPKEAVTSVV